MNVPPQRPTWRKNLKYRISIVGKYLGRDDTHEQVMTYSEFEHWYTVTEGLFSDFDVTRLGDSCVEQRAR